MAEYRSGRQVVEAALWAGEPIGVAGETATWTYEEAGETEDDPSRVMMHTVANEFEIDETTWIITTEDGSVFPVADKVFQSMWEPA